MASRPLFLTLGVTVLLFGWDAAAQTSSYPLEFETKIYQNCTSLSLGATLSFNYSLENRLDIAFKAKPSAYGGWVGWGINPQGLQMIGTQALIAFRLGNGSTVVGTYDVVNKTAALNPSAISLNVIEKSAVYESSSGKITIFASLVLNSSQTSINQVWQVGSSVNASTPGIHSTYAADLTSPRTLDLQSGASQHVPHNSSSKGPVIGAMTGWVAVLGFIIALVCCLF